MEIPKEVRDKFDNNRQDDTVDPRWQKKKSRLMYIKRKLDKDVRKLFNQPVIRYKDIEEIHERHNVRVLSGADRTQNQDS